MAWKARLHFSDGDTLDLEGEYESEEEAEKYGETSMSEYYQGGEVLALAGEDYSDDAVVEIEVYEV